MLWTDVCVTAALCLVARQAQNHLTLQNKHAVIYLPACICVNTVCLHLELAFETILEKMKLDTDVLEKTSA